MNYRLDTYVTMPVEQGKDVTFESEHHLIKESRTEEECLVIWKIVILARSSSTLTAWIFLAKTPRRRGKELFFLAGWEHRAANSQHLLTAAKRAKTAVQSD